MLCFSVLCVTCFVLSFLGGGGGARRIEAAKHRKLKATGFFIGRRPVSGLDFKEGTAPSANVCNLPGVWIEFDWVFPIFRRQGNSSICPKGHLLLKGNPQKTHSYREALF